MRIALSLLAVAACACGPLGATRAAPPAPSAPRGAVADAHPSESFRDHPPAAGPAHPFAPPAATRRTLASGVPVLLVRQPSPFVAIRVMAAGGVLDVAPDRVEVVAAMARTMLAGTAAHSYAGLLERFAALTMPEPEVAWYSDLVSISVVMPLAKLREGASVLGEIALHPVFGQGDFERWRDTAAANAERLSDEAIAENVMRRVLYGSHAYGAGSLSPARLRAVTSADVRALHARLFDASRLSIVVAGPAEDTEIMAALEEAFSSLPAHPTAGTPSLTPAAPPLPAGPRLVVVDRPGAPIATIGMAAPGPTLGAPDFEPLMLALDVLADRQFGRITTRLRDQLQYVPWVATSGASLRTSGSFGWRMRAPMDRVAAAVLETDRIVRAFVASGPTEDELADVKARGVLALASWFETSADTARAFSWPLVYQQPDETIAGRPARFAAVSTSAVRAAVVRHLDAGRMCVVIVGDWATLQRPLSALGWGPVELRTLEGVVVPASPATPGAP